MRIEAIRGFKHTVHAEGLGVPYTFESLRQTTPLPYMSTFSKHENDNIKYCYTNKKADLNLF